MFLGKTIRFVEGKNLKWLPKSGRRLGGRRKPHQEGLVCVQLDVKWVKNNTCTYKKLTGRR
jgi:hypothetical protein